jgi:predicted nucleic acid-binding protein
MMSIEPGLLDANILVYAMDTGAAQHRASLGLLEAASDPATVLYVSSQVLCEFYSIVTNPRRIAALIPLPRPLRRFRHYSHSLAYMFCPRPRRLSPVGWPCCSAIQ